MGWFDNQETLSKADKSVKSKQSRKIEIKLPGSDEYVPISKFQYKRIYSDDIGPRLIIIIDEVAELLTPSGSKTQAAKEEDALKQEIISNIQSITQLGRTAGIHMALCTQRNDANLIPGVIQNNCQQRFVCGRLGSVASMMALGNTQATAIDGSHKGAGMASSQGVVSNVQYYYADPSWIVDWFVKRGLTEKGWETWEDPNASIDASSIDLGNDEENIDMSDSKTVIDFQDIHAEIDNSKDQKFKEV